MAQTFAVRIDDAANWAVFRNDNGAFTQIGNTFNPGRAVITSSESCPSNYAIEYRGNLWCVNLQTGTAGAQLRQLNTATGNWDVIYTTTATISSGQFSLTGLYVTRDSTGVLAMFFMLYSSATTRVHAISTVDGSVFSELTGPTLSGNNSSGFYGGVLARNVLHIANARNMISYDVSSASLIRQIIGTGANGANSTAFARAADGRLFSARITTGTANEYVDLYEFVGGLWVLVIDGSASTPTLPQGDAGNAPFDQAEALAMHYDASADALILHGYQDRAVADAGWRVFQILLTTLAVTEITATVVNPTLAYPNGPDTLAGDDVHFYRQVSNEETPASQTTDIWLLLNNSTWQRWGWNGVATQMTAGGTGGDRGIALAHDQIGGGEYIYRGSTTVDPNLSVEEDASRVALPGAVRIFFRGYTYDETGGGPSDAVEDVELRVSGALQAPSVQGTISAVGLTSGPGPAPTLAANQAVGVTLDNGASLYFVDWEAVVDGFLDNDFVQVMPRIVV